MYKNCYFHKTTNSIYLWDDTKGLLKIPYNHYGFIKDPNGDHVNLFGDRVRKVSRWGVEDEKNMFESDLRPVTRTLIDRYLDSDDMSINVNVMTIDIEVAKNKLTGYSTVENADNTITAIAIHESLNNKAYAFILDVKSKIQLKTLDSAEIFSCKTEEELLQKFYKKYTEIHPDIITGWNIDEFDIPYLYGRTIKVLNKKFANALSPIGIVEKRFSHDDDAYSFAIAGVSCLDYMTLYKKFTYSEESSYALNAIAIKELRQTKLEYDGDLDMLYESDIERFVRYNIKDIQLVIDLDKKLEFISLARGICHKGHVVYEDVFASSKSLEGASLTYLKRMDIVAPNRQHPISLKIGPKQYKGAAKIIVVDTIPLRVPATGQLKIRKTKSSYFKVKYKGFKDDYFILEEPLPEEINNSMELTLDLIGAYVKEPQVGRHDWVYDLDLTALYPMIIISLGISPETKVGRVLNFDGKQFVNKLEKIYEVKIGSHVDKYNTNDFIKYLTDKNYSISASGVLYNKNVKGFIPSILEAWFNERVEYKDLMKKYKKEGDKDKTKFYHNRQLIQKVILNSFYGVLALPSFRFYDVANAESVTAGGQQLIKFTATIANQYYNQVCGSKGIDYAIYSDTDSSFFSSWPIIQKRFPDVKINDIPRCTNETLKIATEVQTFINKSYDLYANRFHNIKSHRFFIKQELIARAGLWIAKKRYAQLIINEEGIMLPAPKLDVKGIDVVRSNFPNAFRTLMSDVITKILEGSDATIINKFIGEFRNGVPALSLLEIMFPSGISDIKKYESIQMELFNFPKGTPAHVKAAIAYNNILQKGKLINIKPITNGDKIKYTYLKQNPYGLESMALKGFEDPIQIEKFIRQYIDHEKVFDTALGNKLQDIFNAMKWGSVISNTAVSDFFSF